MDYAMVNKLVIKDLKIMKPWVLSYWAGGFGAILLAIFGGDTIGTFAFILFITALGAAGVHTIIQTVVIERTEMNLPFIMSLPITGREYTLSKVIANLAIFLSIWVSLSAASFVIFIGDALPRGTVPFFCIVLLSILFAYTMMLTTSLVTRGMGWTVASTVVANIGTQIFLWMIADLHGIRSVIGGPEPVWNSTALGVIGGELLIIVACLVSATLFQFGRKDIL
jgi:hypothetical protein